MQRSARRYIDMSLTLHILTLSVTLSYAAAALAYALHFFQENAAAATLKRPAFWVTVAVHLLALGVMTHEQGYPPIASVQEILTTIALTLSLTYLFIELATGASETGMFVLSVAFVFQLFSTVITRPELAPDASLQSWVLELHIVTALLGYSAVAIAGIYSWLYLLLQRDIDSSRFGLLFRRLPDLETMEKLSAVAVRFGFACLTVAIISGVWWLPQSDLSLGEPKLIGTIAVWAMYGAGLLLKRPLGWQGRRMATLLVFGFFLAFISMTVLNLFSSRFHTN